VLGPIVLVKAKAHSFTTQSKSIAGVVAVLLKNLCTGMASASPNAAEMVCFISLSNEFPCLSRYQLT
jgi:hypothetical protein